MKGFGLNQEKQALTKAILRRDLKQVNQLMTQLEKRLSGEEVLGFLMQILSTLSPEDVNWVTENIISEQMLDVLDEQVTLMFYEMLTSKGFRPGREFSLTEEGFLLSQAAYDAVLPEIPAEYQEVFSTEMVRIRTDSPIDPLEQKLGVPFIDNLLGRIERRLPTLDDREAAMYIYNICTGVENRTNIPMMEILLGHFEEDSKFGKVFDLIQQEKLAENNDWIYDLVASAGGEAEIQPNPNDPSDYQLSQRAIELLDTVYSGKNSLIF
jgi:hypothetical protein